MLKRISLVVAAILAGYGLAQFAARSGAPSWWPDRERDRSTGGVAGRLAVVAEITWVRDLIADVVAALQSGKLAGAYLDVFEREPLDASSPLWDLPNVLVSPHTASHSLGQNEAIFGIFLENLARFRAGQPLRNDVDNLG